MGELRKVFGPSVGRVQLDQHRWRPDYIYCERCGTALTGCQFDPRGTWAIRKYDRTTGLIPELANVERILYCPDGMTSEGVTKALLRPEAEEEYTYGGHDYWFVEKEK